MTSRIEAFLRGEMDSLVRINSIEVAGILVQEIAGLIGRYRRQLVEEGFTPDEAWELSIRLEERLLGPLLDPPESD